MAHYEYANMENLCKPVQPLSVRIDGTHEHQATKAYAGVETFYKYSLTL